jgi:hypothetical protein
MTGQRVKLPKLQLIRRKVADEQFVTTGYLLPDQIFPLTAGEGIDPQVQRDQLRQEPSRAYCAANAHSRDHH